MRETLRRQKVSTVLVTGSSKGIGLQTALLLVGRKFRVIMIARDAQDLEVAAHKVRKEACKAGLTNADVETLSADVSDFETLRKKVPKLRLLRGGLFGLVNNAASEIVKPLMKFEQREMEAVFRVNMLAPAVLTQICFPFLKKCKGSIVNVGSLADRVRSPGYSIYGGSKAFLTSFSAHLATELGFDGIRVNTVTPGGVDTPLMKKIEAQFPAEEIRREKSRIPISQRWGKSSEVSEVIHFCLTGPEYLNAADIRVDGGVF